VEVEGFNIASLQVHTQSVPFPMRLL